MSIMDNVLGAVAPRKKRDKGYEALMKVHAFHKEHGELKTVYPGKGLSSSEIRARVRNRSLKPGLEGLQFTDQKEVEALKGMSKIDLMRSHANEKPKLAEKKANIDKLAKGGKDGKG